MSQFDTEFITQELINSRQEWVLTFLYKKYYGKLRYYAKYLVRDDFMIDDIVQDVFLRFWYKMGNNSLEFTTITALENYFFMSVRFDCLNLINRKARFVNKYNDIADKDMFDDIAAVNRLRTVQGLIKDNKLLMPQQMRKIMIAFLIEGKRLVEVRKELGLSRQAVLTQRRLGIKMLNDYFVHGKTASIARLIVYNNQLTPEKEEKVRKMVKINKRVSIRFIAYEAGISYRTAQMLKEKILSEPRKNTPSKKNKLAAAVELVLENPDITLMQIAKQFGLKSESAGSYWKYKAVDKINADKEKEAALKKKLKAV